jgi:hypothetical protein
MPSAMQWTIGWGLYAGWIMKETWDLRTCSVGWTPLTLMDAYKTKERYLRSKAMLEKYNEELEAVDEAAPSDEDARKFELLRPTPSLNLWEQFKFHPYWQTVEEAISMEVRQRMLEDHPAYGQLLKAVEEGGNRKLWLLDGPWMGGHFEDGLEGRFKAWSKVQHHHH